jgi:hypothetical protein
VVHSCGYEKKGLKAKTGAVQGSRGARAETEKQNNIHHI